MANTIVKSVHVRKAQLNDIGALFALENLCFDSDRISRKQFNYLLHSKTVVGLVVERASEIVAYTMLLFRKNSSIARCYSIAVAPFLQGKGLGQLLLHSMEHEARMRQASHIQLEVKRGNCKAICLYQEWGYEIVGEYRHYYQDGEDAFRMRKILLPSNHMKLK